MLLQMALKLPFFEKFSPPPLNVKERAWGLSGKTLINFTTFLSVLSVLSVLSFLSGFTYRKTKQMESSLLNLKS